ncbi:hypothetical protein [Peribacillus glennii]|uniref:Uncharacterized protein n=1 Tax=Peribacillus glennii TaxID=2303991 RepID=A0A372LCN0_9BACI|nr:hypothetical protein [Peribacillus glennii]RFU62844.1 hypothetical protein D0466_12875 [Peribacillus glennii]
MRRVSLECPKCKQHHTYDLIPDLPAIPEIQLSDSDTESSFKQTIGNAKYHCTDCGYTWKKYRGKKPYGRIKVNHAYTGIPRAIFHSKGGFGIITG